MNLSVRIYFYQWWSRSCLHLWWAGPRCLPGMSPSQYLQHRSCWRWFERDCRHWGLCCTGHWSLCWHQPGEKCRKECIWTWSVMTTDIHSPLVRCWVGTLLTRGCPTQWQWPPCCHSWWRWRGDRWARLCHWMLQGWQAWWWQNHCQTCWQCSLDGQWIG